MRDGRMWFPTIKGIAIIDPRQQAGTPPPVVIEQVRLDREMIDFGCGVEVAPGRGNLEIQYTGLHFGKPEQVRFKYKLDRLDADWIDAGARRSVSYSYLPPGKYTFHVMAASLDGVWSETSASLALVVRPPFYRTWWFILSVAAALGGLAWLGYQRRVRQLLRAKAAQEEFSRQLIASQEAERKRIASELHDCLGQNLLIIKNRALLGLVPQALPDGTREQLDAISAASSQAIEEVREIAYNLRPYQIDRLGLTRSIESMVKKVAIASEIQFTLDVAELNGIFSKDSEINFFRIVQECLNNIVKHSGATEAKVTVKRSDQIVLLRIEDNGKGFAAEQNAASESGQQGFGLVGLAERVRILGGIHNLKSAPGQGTVISITIATEGNQNGH